jgi:transcriptional regulator with XRE-family HTH domain
MSRFHQRLRQRMQNPEFAAGYWEMDTELQLVQALDALRQLEGLSVEEISQRMGRHREAISRLFNSERPNPTLETFSHLLRALGVTADITLRRSQEGDPSIKVRVDVPGKVPA